MKEVLRLDHGVLTHFPASAGRNKPALILCPGGGYEYCSIREGAPVARAFARDGVEAFVLEEYDCTEVPLGVKPLHAVRVCRLGERTCGTARHRGRPHCGRRIFGGAHLAGLLAATWHDADWFPAGTDLQAHRPNAAVLCAIRWSRQASMPIAAALLQLAGENAAEQRRFFTRNAGFCTDAAQFPMAQLTDATVPVENAAARGGFAPRTSTTNCTCSPSAYTDSRSRGFETADPMKGRVPDRHINRWQALCAEWLKEE